MKLKWAIICFLAAVFIPSNCLNWMAGGTFTQEEFAILRAKVDNFNKATNAPIMAAAAKTMSDELNDLWAPAWNVVITVYMIGNYDTIHYGYGFNNRWFWFNGFQLTEGYYISFIIWKDFNCVTWFTYNPAGGSPVTASLHETIVNQVQGTLEADRFLAIRDLNDIWKAAQNIQSKIPISVNSLLQDPLAYTIIASQSSAIGFFARFCAVGFMTAYNFGRLNNADSGSALILQMRSS